MIGSDPDAQIRGDEHDSSRTDAHEDGEYPSCEGSQFVIRDGVRHDYAREDSTAETRTTDRRDARHQRNEP